MSSNDSKHRPRALRAQAVIGALLAVALFIVGARLVERHLRLRADFSEDRLLSFSPATDTILGRLEDVAQLELFFTSEIENGAWQLTKNRLMEQLADLAGRSGGRLQLVFRDPARSSQARLEAIDYGIRALRTGRQGGGVLVAQEVFLGGVLRYRGAERVLPALFPTGLEYTLLSNLHGLMQPRPLRVGWIAGGETPERYSTARDLLARRAEIVPVGGLAEGRPVGDVDVLVLAGPTELHPRAAFEIDQFVQAGGALLAAVDPSHADLAGRRFSLAPSGLADVLDAWGARVSRAHLWDQDHHRGVRMQQVVRQGDKVVPVGNIDVPWPLLITVDSDGLDPSHPATSRLDGLPLFWAHPIEDEVVPDGLERVELARTSKRSYLESFAPELVLDVQGIRQRDAEHLMSGDGRSYTVATALTGRFPSAFAGGPPPPARDPFGGPDAPLEDEPEVLTGGSGRVVVVGDADWMAAVEGITARPDPVAQLFLENLVDWLGAAPELLALRSKLPRDRSIRDLLEDEFAAAGLSRVRGEVGSTASTDASNDESAAIARAETRRRNHALAALAGSVAAAAMLALAAWLRRRMRLSGFESAVRGGSAA